MVGPGDLGEVAEVAPGRGVGVAPAELLAAAAEHVGRLFACFPRARLLFIHRHPVDVYSSYVRRGRTDPRELAAVCAFLGEPFDLARFGYASAVR